MNRLVVGEPAVGGESGAVWHGTFEGRPVIVKRAEAAARPRLDAVAALLERLRARGVPAPAYTLLDDDGDELVYVQTVLPGEHPTRPLDAAYVGDVIAATELLVGAPDVPAIHELDWPALLHRTLTVGEQGWCQHGPMRTHSPRTKALLEHVMAHGAELDVAAVPTADAVHLDLHPANTLVVHGRLTGVIDWDGVLPGDRWFDVAYFAHHVDLWRGDGLLTAGLWPTVESALTPAVLGAYAAHIALRTVEWQVSHHGPGDVEHALAAAERLVARYP